LSVRRSRKAGWGRGAHRDAALFGALPLYYPDAMNKLLRSAVEAVSRLSPESQDEIARAMLRLAESDGEPEAIDPAHLSAVLEGLAQSKRGVFATETEVEAAFRRFDS
jgi:hypothetical protein